ncbi:MAG: porin [Xanthobacteraceae bacterium]|nr:porin [Xanthobacteraceae bacterium]
MLIFRLQPWRRRAGPPAIGLAALAAGLALSGAARAAPVDYVKVCARMGVDYFFIPGTDVCQNASAISSNQFDVARDFQRALVGVAMTGALVTPFIPDNARYAVAVHWGTYEGVNAVGFAGAARLIGNWSVEAGFALGLDRGSVTFATVKATENGPYTPVQSWSSVDVMGKLGLNYAW